MVSAFFTFTKFKMPDFNIFPFFYFSVHVTADIDISSFKVFTWFALTLKAQPLSIALSNVKSKSQSSNSQDATYNFCPGSCQIQSLTFSFILVRSKSIFFLKVIDFCWKIYSLHIYFFLVDSILRIYFSHILICSCHQDFQIWDGLWSSYV